MVVFALGVVAGLLTTVTGMGGGMLLLLALSVLWDPWAALAATAPALLVGNTHRAWMYRAAIERRIALAIAGGGLPGSFLGGLFITEVPAGVLHVMMAAMVGLAAVKVLGGLRLQVSARLLLPVGAINGAVTAGAGGAGLLTAPLLMSAGLSGEAYVATAAVCSLSMHAGRLAAYGAADLVTPALLAWSVGLALAITLGNALGHRIRARVDAALSRRLELGALLTAAGLALVGVT